MTVLELLKDFLTAYFVEHNPDRGIALVTDDIRGYGFADDQEITGIEDLKKVYISEAYRKFMEAELKIEKEDQISEENAVLHYSLNFQNTMIRGRIAGNFRQTPEGNRLYFIDNTLRDDYILEQLKLEKQVIDELFENLPGGVVMYQWDGENLYPLYVSNGLSDLYGEDGESVIRRTEGLEFDLVHPEDLEKLQTFVTENIDKTGQNRTLRYRVWNKEKKDYIWLQLTGNVKRQSDGTSIVYANYANVDVEVKAAEEVKKEEKMLETACNLAHIWTFQYNILEKRIFLSNYLQKSLQLPDMIEDYPDRFLKYPVIPKEYHELYRQMIRKVDAGEDATTEMQLCMPDGTRCDVRFEWHITKKKAGKAIEVAGFAIDITQEIAERNRFDKERQKMLGGDKKLTGYCIIDLENEIAIDAKDYYLGSGIKTGDTCRELGVKTAPFLFEKSERERFLDRCNHLKELYGRGPEGPKEWSEDMKWINSKGHVRWQRSVYTIVENRFTGAHFLYCYLYDVLGEKVMQSLFVGIQKNLYTKLSIVSLTTNQLYVYEGNFPSRSLKVVDYNNAVKKYTREEVLAEEADMVAEQISLSNIKKELASNSNSFSFVHRIMEEDTLHYRQMWYAPVPGEINVYVIAIRDVTDLVKEAEQKNVELQKALEVANAATQTKSEFLSRMSHEIRTPMNAIMGMTAIAQDNKSDFLQVSDCLSKIDSSSKYLLTLINDILEMSRIESGNAKLSKERFEFTELIGQIRTVTEPLAHKSGIRLDISNITTNGSYYGDHIRIQQVMLNLLGNAIKFTKRSGRVRFVISAVEETETTTTFEFMVEDTGIGMSEKFMQKMFEPFSQEDSTTTSQYGGSGLGLAISKSLIEAMNGTITVESMVGIGTNFTVRIPLEKAQSTLLLQTEKMDEMTEEEKDAILKGKRILMAEDHPMNIMIAKKLLERKEVEITIAENGKIAVEIFCASHPEEYDAILMDIRMPVMDGLEATRQIRALDRPDAKTIPIIAMTANALEEDRKNSKAAGMDEHLAKPIEPKKMYQIIAKQMKKEICE